MNSLLPKKGAFSRLYIVKTIIRTDFFSTTPQSYLIKVCEALLYPARGGGVGTVRILGPVQHLLLKTDNRRMRQCSDQSIKKDPTSCLNFSNEICCSPLGYNFMLEIGIVVGLGTS